MALSLDAIQNKSDDITRILGRLVEEQDEIMKKLREMYEVFSNNIDTGILGEETDDFIKQYNSTIQGITKKFNKVTTTMNEYVSKNNYTNKMTGDHINALNSNVSQMLKIFMQEE